MLSASRSITGVVLMASAAPIGGEHGQPEGFGEAIERILDAGWNLGGPVNVLKRLFVDL